MSTEPTGGPAASAVPTAPARTVVGLRWRAHELAAERARLDAVAVAGERIFVAGTDRDVPTIWLSDDDGHTWVKRTMEYPHGPSEDLRLEELAASGARVVALGYDRTSPIAEYEAHLWHSSDAGESWSYRGTFVSPYVGRLVGDDAGFTAVGSLRQDREWFIATWTSPDGLAWDRSLLPRPTELQLTDILANEEQVVVLGAESPTFQVGPHAWLSRSGGAWQELTIDRAAGVFHEVVAWNDWYVVGGSLEKRRAAAWTSTDSVTWTSIRMRRPLASVVRDVIVGSSGILLLGGREVPEWEIYSGAYTWFVRPGTDRAVLLEPDVGAWHLIADDERFIGVGTCGGARPQGCPALVIAEPVYE